MDLSIRETIYVILGIVLFVVLVSLSYNAFRKGVCDKTITKIDELKSCILNCYKRGINENLDRIDCYIVDLIPEKDIVVDNLDVRGFIVNSDVGVFERGYRYKVKISFEKQNDNDIVHLILIV